MKDREILKFAEENELLDAVKKQISEESWIEIPTYKISAYCVGEGEAPLLAEHLTNSNNLKMAPDVTSDDVLDVMRLGESCTYITVHEGFNEKTYPVRYTGINDIYDRAGIAGRSIRANKSCGMVSNWWGPEKKAEILSDCYKMNETNSKILIRDGKISAIHSARYERLEATELIDSFKKLYSNVSFSDGILSHEGLYAKYEIQDTSKYPLIMDALKDLNVNDVTAGFEIQTSDVGSSTARLIPYVNINGISVSAGKHVALRHVSGNDIEVWKRLISNAAPLLREIVGEIKKLMNIPVMFPAFCLRNALSETSIPAQDIEDIVMQMMTETSNQTAFDIYFYSNMAVNKHIYNNDANMSIDKRFELKKSVAALLTMDFNTIDKAA